VETERVRVRVRDRVRSGARNQEIERRGNGSGCIAIMIFLNGPSGALEHCAGRQLDSFSSVLPR